MNRDWTDLLAQTTDTDVENRHLHGTIAELVKALEWVSRLVSADGQICDHRYNKLIRDAAKTADAALAHARGEQSPQRKEWK
jgi:hypothetical protein